MDKQEKQHHLIYQLCIHHGKFLNVKRAMIKTLLIAKLNCYNPCNFQCCASFIKLEFLLPARASRLIKWY